MVLQSDRLTLRELVPEDFEAVHAYASDPLVTQWMIWGPNTGEQTHAFLNTTIACQEQTPRQGYPFAVVLRDSGQLIGACDLRLIPSDRAGEIGYVYHHPFWRQGYASEAGRALLRFGFGELGLHRIFATCDVRNVGSAAVLRKIGMRHEGTLLSHMMVKGRWRDTHMFAILEEEWAAART